jgi:hypothetical protein
MIFSAINTHIIGGHYGETHNHARRGNRHESTSLY